MESAKNEGRQVESDAVMSDTELTNLECQVDALIHSRLQLEQENLSLRKQLTKMTQKHALLSNKVEGITGKIKRIITHLRNDLS